MNMSAEVRMPDVPVQPHMASLEMLFYYSKDQRTPCAGICPAGFPAQYYGGAFVAEHGSWNRAPRAGYEVIFIPTVNGHAAGEYDDFLTGFVTKDGQVWGRPVGVAVGNDGSLFVTDDGSRSVWHVTAQPAPSGLAAILAQMDAASVNFRSAQASIRKEQFEKIVHDITTETGTIYFLRNGATVQMGAKFDPPAAQTVEYKGDLVRLYTPSTNHVEQYSATGKDHAQVDTFVTLGFGGSGKDLARAWSITDQGSEQIVDGGKPVKVEKLDLVSKDPSVRNTFTHITIWIDPVRDVTLKQQYFAPGGDTNTVTYSNIRLNLPIDLKAYAIHCKGACN
jgi:outer membrane lipoprotein-sorting protein